MLLTIRPEEESEAVQGKADVERFTMGGVVDPLPSLDRLVGRLVDKNESHMGQEEKPYPDVVVGLGKAKTVNQDNQENIRKALKV